MESNYHFPERWGSKEDVVLVCAKCGGDVYWSFREASEWCLNCGKIKETVVVYQSPDVKEDSHG